MSLPGNYSVFTAPPPASGSVILFIVNVMSQVAPTATTTSFWKDFVETLKYAYGFRTKLGDENFSENVTQVKLVSLM